MEGRTVKLVNQTSAHLFGNGTREPPAYSDVRIKLYEEIIHSKHVEAFAPDPADSRALPRKAVIHKPGYNVPWSATERRKTSTSAGKRYESRTCKFRQPDITEGYLAQIFRDGVARYIRVQWLTKGLNPEETKLERLAKMDPTIPTVTAYSIVSLKPLEISKPREEGNSARCVGCCCQLWVQQPIRLIVFVANVDGKAPPSVQTQEMSNSEAEENDDGSSGQEEIATSGRDGYSDSDDSGTDDRVAETRRHRCSTLD
ncbi:hypothetical protein FB45DRAFT_880911 [Roridomyces roridus]|uniref:Uncharacterized protein n=1 Tax=Roridomyces roridus TaxID=1738132 RepID=A0AAD7AYY4_9AGAR|nr:hypothetical protein FB45DRAFT_880911 [Roridomyces roridus]